MNAADDREEALFREALQRAIGPERENFLNQACAGNPALRGRLEALLKAHESPDPFLEPLAVAPDNATVRLPPEEDPGTLIGRYKLLQKIGEGGCGVVYMAEQEEPVRRRVAFKIIKLGMDTKQVVARFEAERQALAMMDHPNIAKVLDAGATETGRPYFVMELVRGVPITTYCDQNKLPTVERLKLFLQVCHAIQHAHQKGIIHRDIKPSNILVSLHDDVPVPKVIDFGIAKAIGERLTDKTVFTRFEQFIGTPAYMSPEQAGVSGLDIDTRSDIYALGVLLYELLTGRPPFDSKELAQAGMEEMLRRIREAEPPKPSTRLSALDREDLTTTAQHHRTEPPKLISLLRGDLDWIVMKCLEKNRTRRYETANALARDIEHHLNHEPVTAAAPSALYLAGKFVRRHKTGLATATALVLLLAAGAVVSTWQAVRATRAERDQIRLRQQAEANEKKAQAEANKSLEVIQFLNSMLNGAGQSIAQRRETTIPREILDQTAERIVKDLKNQPDVEVRLLSTLGGIYRMLGENEKAEAMHRQTLAMQRKLLGEEHPDVARSLTFLASVLDDQGKLAEAETVCRQALAMRRKLLGEEHRDVAQSLANLAWVVRNQGKLAEAETLFRQTLAMRRKLFGEEHPEVAWSLASLGFVLYEESRLAEAETDCRQALAMYRKLLGEEHRDVAWSLCTLASVLRDQGKLAEAETVGRQALAMRRKLLGEEHRDVAQSLVTLAWVLRDESRLAEAETMGRAALAMRRKLLGEEHRLVAESLGLLASVLHDESRLAEAETMGRAALAMRRKLLGEEHRDVAQSLTTLGWVLHGQGRLAEAETLFRQALAMRRKLFGEEHREVALSLAHLAFVLREESRLTEADTACRQALAMQRKLLGEEHREVAWSLANLTWELHAEGKLAEAETMGRATLAMRRKLLGEEHPDVAQSLAELALVIRDEGRLAEAETMGRAALAMRRKLLGEEHRDVGWSLADLAWVLRDQGKLAEAEPMFRQALAMRRKLLAVEHPEVAQLRNDLVGVLRGQGKLGEAAVIYREGAEGGDPEAMNDIAWFLATCEDPTMRDGSNAVRLAENAVAETGGQNPKYLDTLAAAYAEAGRFADAMNAQQEAIAFMQDENWKKVFASRLRLYESGSPYRDDDMLAKRTWVLLASGKFAEAEPLARECLGLREKQIPEHWGTFDARNMLGGSLLGQKKFAAAEPLLLSGYEGMKQRENQIPPINKPHLKEAIQRLVELYNATGHADKAAEWKLKLAEFEKAETDKQPATPPR